MAEQHRGRFPPDEDNPWQRLERREVYRNPWMTVTEDRVIRPDGEEGIYGVVSPASIALGVVPLDAEQHVWLVGQFRYALDCYSWEIPEGGGDPRLDLRQEAARELREETGLRAGRWDHLLTVHTSNCFTSERGEIYLARALTPGPASPEGSEKLRLLRLPLAEALDAVRRGQITDAVSVAGLLAAERFLAA